MRNKKGVSAVVATLIILAIVLMGIGIVMYVIMPLFEGTSENIDYSAKCLSTGVTILSADYNEGVGILDVTLKRRAGISRDEFGGVILKATDGEKTSEEDISGNIAALESKNRIVVGFLDPNTGFTPTKVDANVYFVQEDGEKYICTQTTTKAIGDLNDCEAQGNECVAAATASTCTRQTSLDGTCESDQVCCEPTV
jgi:hypothetical protein